MQQVWRLRGEKVKKEKIEEPWAKELERIDVVG